MNIKQFLSIIDANVPFNSAESWDNVGLLIGDESSEVDGVLTALDCTAEVVEEAIDKKCNTIVAHHPLIFKGVKSIVNDGAYGKVLYQLIQNNINLIALHTNLDNHPNGVNAMLADRIGLNHIELLNQTKETYYKVQVYIPKDNAKELKDALSDHQIAKEDDYEYCFFNTQGDGQFKPVDHANPTIGTLNQIETVEEVKVEFMIHASQMKEVTKLIHQYHPYEVPVFDIIPMERLLNRGLGMIGDLDDTCSVEDFVKHVKSNLNIDSVKYTGSKDAMIKKVAIIGGAGIGFEYLAKRMGADIFITGDIKHHEALDAKTNGVNLLDISHYSEYVVKDGLVTLLHDWVGDIEVYASQVDTDPFHYM